MYIRTFYRKVFVIFNEMNIFCFPFFIIPFIISNGDKLDTKIFPIEVKSSKKYKITSLERFQNKYKKRIDKCYIIHTKNLKVEDNKIYLPCYMTMFID